MQKLMTFAATWTVLFMLSLWTPADAATVNQTQAAKSNAAAATTDISARRYYRGYRRGYYRPYYYGPGPYYGYGYGYRPYYYRPYYAPPPFPFFGFPFF